MLKELIAGGILSVIAIGLYAEARYQVKDNTQLISENQAEIKEIKVHQSYNAVFFVQIKDELIKINNKLDKIKWQF